MKTPREVAHEILAASFECNFGWVHQGITIDLHSMACDTATAAIEARDAEHAAEVARWLDLVEKGYGTWPYAGSAADMLRDGEWRLGLARLDAATPAVVPAETLSQRDDEDAYFAALGEAVERHPIASSRYAAPAHTTPPTPSAPPAPVRCMNGCGASDCTRRCSGVVDHDRVICRCEDHGGGSPPRARASAPPREGMGPGERKP